MRLSAQVNKTFPPRASVPVLRCSTSSSCWPYTAPQYPTQFWLPEAKGAIRVSKPNCAHEGPIPYQGQPKYSKESIRLQVWKQSIINLMNASPGRALYQASYNPSRCKYSPKCKSTLSWVGTRQCCERFLLIQGQGLVHQRLLSGNINTGSFCEKTKCQPPSKTLQDVW